MLAIAASLLALLGLSYAEKNFSNPTIFADFPDNDVSKGPDGAYYFSASSFQFSPGAPILKSMDLVNWEFIGHSVPMLDFGEGYNMTGSGSLPWVGGIWASTMRYRESNGLWYWIGCVGFWDTYIYTATNVTGPWEKSAVLNGNCYYDCGLLIDDDDTMYVAYGNNNPSIAQLAPDGLSQVATQQLLSTPSGDQGIEGNRLYKINGTYYVLDDSPQGITLIWKSSSIWGPYEYQVLQQNVGSPLSGGGLIDQGSLVEGPDGTWYFVSCSWDYPSGRIPLMAPIQWSDDGWPSLVMVDGAWGASYPFPAASASPTNYSFTGTDRFRGKALGPEWEWNFNPDTTKFSVNHGLTLHTATVTDDLYASRNVLTHRVYGQSPVGTAEIDFSKMADGDRFGLGAFRDQSSWIEVGRIGGAYTASMMFNSSQDPNNSWETISLGTNKGNATLSGTKIWLQTSMNVLPGSDKLATFAYSTDGSNFTQLGTPFEMDTGYQYFTGYRFCIFNIATKALGGSIKVLSFENQDASS